MKELDEVRVWLETLDFSGWTADEDEQTQWLDLRDAPSFESQWLRVYNLVLEQEKSTPLNQDEEEVVQEIRKKAFFKVIQLTGNGELSAEASDDFELLARATRVGLRDFWLDKLRSQYEAGRFPCGAL